MKRQLLKTLTLVSAVVVGSALSARATVDMTFTWNGTYYQYGYTADAYQGNSSSHLISYYDAIGIYSFNTSGQGISNPYWSICLSPAGLLDGGTHTYDVLSFADANPGIYPTAWAWGVVNNTPQYWGVNNAAYLWNTYGMDIVNNTGNIGYQNQRAAALQFAVWTSLYNSRGYGQLGGNVWSAPTSQMDSTTLSYYNNYLTVLTSAGLTGPLFTGDVLRGVNYTASGQQQEFFLLGTPVPEPTTMIADALLLLPFGASTLRILRKGRAA